MTFNFRHLANELMEQGFRCYSLPFPVNTTTSSRIQAFAIRNLLEVRVYEGKSLVFVKDSKENDTNK